MKTYSENKGLFEYFLAEGWIEEFIRGRPSQLETLTRLLFAVRKEDQEWVPDAAVRQDLPRRGRARKELRRVRQVRKGREREEVPEVLRLSESLLC